MYLVNGMITFVIYTVVLSRQSNLEPGARRYVLIICASGAVSMVFSILNLLGDQLAASERWRVVGPIIRFDRHFRVVSCVKLIMLHSKVLVLMNFKISDHSPVLVSVLQIIAVAATSMVSTRTAFRVIVTARDTVHVFDNLFRKPRLVWSGSLMGLLVLQASYGAVALNELLSAMGVRGAASQAELLKEGPHVFGGFLWIWVTNELALFLSSASSDPPVFEAVPSVRGVSAILSILQLDIAARFVLKTDSWLECGSGSASFVWTWCRQPLAVVCYGCQAALWALGFLVWWSLGSTRCRAKPDG